ncbi:winged helix-turn-helix domain-containing protein [Aquimarina rhabdastrellae]
MSKYKIKSRIWLELNDRVVLGEGRVRLLKAIEEKGSLSQAAKMMKMSYKKAWTLVEAINTAAEKTMVIKNKGGKDGGGAQLTSYAKELIIVFDEINAECWKDLEAKTKKIIEL